MRWEQNQHAEARSPSPASVFLIENSIRPGNPINKILYIHIHASKSALFIYLQVRWLQMCIIFFYCLIYSKV